MPQAFPLSGIAGLIANAPQELDEASQLGLTTVEIRADLLLAGDLGCLMNMGGKLSREGHPVKARHVVEVLAGMTDGPAIGEGRG